MASGVLRERRRQVRIDGGGRIANERLSLSHLPSRTIESDIRMLPLHGVVDLQGNKQIHEAEWRKRWRREGGRVQLRRWREEEEREKESKKAERPGKWSLHTSLRVRAPSGDCGKGRDLSQEHRKSGGGGE